MPDRRHDGGGDEIVLATYNVEALFDCEKDPEKQDHEYLPHGFYAWTEEKLKVKLANLGRVIRTIDGGRGPDILALNEVENFPVAERLLRDALDGLGYVTLVHLETDDLHGLDNVLLSRYPLRAPACVHSATRAGMEPAKRPRGVLEATLDVDGVALTIFVNHWPAGRAPGPRLGVARMLRRLLEERILAEPDAEIVVLGDFNAGLDDEALGRAGLGVSADDAAVRDGAPGATLFHAAAADPRTHFTRPWPYKGPEGAWNALDHVFVSRGLLDDDGLTWVSGSTAVVREDFMLADDGTPRPFFERGVRPREQKLERAGFSDHLPVVTRLRRAPRK